MKFELSLVIILLALSNLSEAVTITDPIPIYACFAYKLDIGYDIILDSKDYISGKPSNYKFPILKEGDLLNTIGLNVTDINSFDITNHTVNVEITSPSGIVHNWIVVIDELNESRNIYYPLNSRFQLDEIGKWKIEIINITTPKDPNVKDICYNGIFDKSITINGRDPPYNTQFEVRSKDIIDTLEISRNNLSIAFWASIFSLAALMLSFFGYRQTNKHNKKIIKLLKTIDLSIKHYKKRNKL